jgi:hypothetical protein
VLPPGVTTGGDTGAGWPMTGRATTAHTSRAAAADDADLQEPDMRRANVASSPAGR